MSGPELKPCPFCGRGAEFVEAQGYPASGWRVHCDYCGAWADGKQWNTRAPVDYAALPEVHAMIAVAFEAAAQSALDQERACSEWFSTTGKHANVYEQFPIFADRIRAMTPADAIAARDAMIAEAEARAFADGRAAERGACAAMCDGLALEISYHLMSTSVVNALRSAAAAIRKRGEGKP